MSMSCEQHSVRTPFPTAALKISVLVICEENWFDSPEGRSVHFTVQIVPSCHSLGPGMTRAASWRTSSSLAPGLFGYFQLWGCQRGLASRCVSCNVLTSSFKLLCGLPNIFMQQLSVVVFDILWII